MKLSKKYNRIGWTLALAAILGAIATSALLGKSVPQPLDRSIAVAATDALIAIGVYYWGKSSGAKKLEA